MARRRGGPPRLVHPSQPAVRYGPAQGPAQEVKAFLQETEAMVPWWTELGHSDFDRLLAHLLAEG